LNPHAFRHTPLKRTCLPFHHPSKSGKFNQEKRKARRQGRAISGSQEAKKLTFECCRSALFLVSWFPDSS
jgi:hypothetical protein